MTIDQAQQDVASCYRTACWDLVPLEQACIHILEELGEVARPLLTYQNRLANKEHDEAKEFLVEAGCEVADAQILILALVDMCDLDLANSISRFLNRTINLKLTFNDLLSIGNLGSIENILLRLISEMGLLSTSIMELSSFKDRGTRVAAMAHLETSLVKLTILLSAIAQTFDIDFDFYIDKQIKSVIKRANASDTNHTRIYLSRTQANLDRLIKEFDSRSRNRGM